MAYGQPQTLQLQRESQAKTQSEQERRKRLLRAIQLRNAGRLRQMSVLPPVDTVSTAAQMAATLASKADKARVRLIQAGALPKGSMARYLAGANNIKQLARRIEKLGYNVGELEGFQEQGQITGGHTENSLHYAGLAMDITGSRLGRLFRALKRAFGPDVIDEMFFRNKFYGYNEAPVSGHDNHVHLGLLRRRF